MEILEVTSKQFREKQNSFFELADTGKKIVIRRGRKQAYALMPVTDRNETFTSNELERIDESAEQIRRGEFVRYTPELEQQLFGDHV
ncbi:MAG: hypothetical protein LBJ23_09995 [Tannerella sp.]|jgi:hypothetical protein|nr:hypothetical protein [Tannerella sp.]